MNKNFIWEVGEYIANGHKISEAADHFNKSISSIKKYLAKIRNKDSDCYNEILAEKIKLAQAKIELEGHIKGGSLGKRGKIYEEWQIEMLLESFIASGLSLAAFADLILIPKSTLYDLFCNVQNSLLKNKFREYMERYISSNEYDKGYDIERTSWKK